MEKFTWFNMSTVLTIFIFQSLMLACICDNNNIETIKNDALIASSNIKNNDNFETQKTICKITSDNIIADAEATVTKVVTGACNAKCMKEHFKSFEVKITHRLIELTHLIYDLIDKKITQKHHKNISSHANGGINNSLLPDEVEAFQQQMLENTIENAISARQQEIEKFNNTVNEIYDSYGPCKVFTYYWRVDDINEKLSTWKSGNSLRSPTFYIQQSGYAMFMRFTPKYFLDGTIFVSVGLTKGARDNELVWPFPLKLRIEILDHSSTRKVRKSHLWDPTTVCLPHFWGKPAATGDNAECVGVNTSRLSFSFPDKYIVNDSVFIKLTVYLSSH